MHPWPALHPREEHRGATRLEDAALDFGGFEMGVCINDGTPQNVQQFKTAYSDVYVNRTPGPTNCQLFIEQWVGGTRVDVSDPVACSGHQLSNAFYAPFGCKLVHTSAYIINNGNFVRIGDSPTFKFCN